MDYIEAYFIVPPEYFNAANSSFCLYHDSGEVLPIDHIINAFPIWRGPLQAHGGLERIVCKVRLEPATVIAFHHQLTTMVRRDLWETLSMLSQEAALLFAKEIADNMTVSDVISLGILKMYGGRTFDGLLSNYPELQLTDIQDMQIA